MAVPVTRLLMSPTERLIGLFVFIPLPVPTEGRAVVSALHRVWSHRSDLGPPEPAVARDSEQPFAGDVF